MPAIRFCKKPNLGTGVPPAHQSRRRYQSFRFPKPNRRTFPTNPVPATTFRTFRPPKSSLYLRTPQRRARFTQGATAGGQSGWVAEWFKAAVLKTAVPVRVPGVRIPPHPLISGGSSTLAPQRGHFVAPPLCRTLWVIFTCRVTTNARWSRRPFVGILPRSGGKPGRIAGNVRPRAFRTRCCTRRILRRSDGIGQWRTAHRDSSRRPWSNRSQHNRGPAGRTRSCVPRVSRQGKRSHTARILAHTGCTLRCMRRNGGEAWRTSPKTFGDVRTRAARSRNPREARFVP